MKLIFEEVVLSALFTFLQLISLCTYYVAVWGRGEGVRARVCVVGMGVYHAGKLYAVYRCME